MRILVIDGKIVKIFIALFLVIGIISYMETQKHCSRCGQLKLLVSYHRDDSKPDKHRPDCKTCANALARKYSKQPHIKKQRKAYKQEWLKNRPEYFRLYHLTNLQSIKKQKHKYYQSHKKEVAMKNKKYRSDIAKRLYHQAKKRAKTRGVLFTITTEDIVVPETCPALGIELNVGSGHACDNSPSIDEINHGEGYTKENIIVVSHKANTMKSNATISELAAVAKFYNSLIKG